MVSLLSMININENNALDRWINKRLQNPKNLLWYLLVFIGLFFILLPIILTQYWKWVPVKFDSNTGVIGDTVGGIFGPFVALFGVILTFFAFYMQYKANEKQNEILAKQREKERELEHEKAINNIEKRFFFLIDHYFRLENQLNHTGMHGKASFGVFLEELKVVLKAVRECVMVNYNISFLTNNHKYAIIRISVDLWYFGFEKRNEPRGLLTDILQMFNHFTQAGDPLDVKYRLTHQNQDLRDFPLIKNLAAMSSFGLQIVSMGLTVKDVNTGRSNLLSAYVKAIFNIFTFVNNKDNITLNYQTKREWIKFFVQLMSDEEMELFAYLGLSNCLNGLEIGPKDNLIFIEISDEPDEVLIKKLIDKMIISKYEIFQDFFYRINPDFGVEDAYIDHTRAEGVIIAFNYEEYKKIWYE
jgi:hypothetical protein